MSDSFKCRVCSKKISPFMSFGEMPLGNGFKDSGQKEKEYKFEMRVAVCENCSTFQLIDQPEPEKMFHDEYAFFSGTSERMADHFKQFANEVNIEVKGDSKEKFIVEIGSNDGILIGNFAKLGISHLGIEPSSNVANVAISKGINTKVSFFSKEIAQEVTKEYGKADALMAANVICHIPTIKDIAEGVEKILKDDGIFVFEEPYLGDVLEKITYDQIYDEHVFLFSLSSVNEIFKRVGMEIFRAEKQWTHGGSMRYWISKKGKRNIEKSVQSLLKFENDICIRDHKTYINFKKSCEEQKLKLFNVLEDLRKRKKRVVGYGATSKSTTILNYCGIKPHHIEFISDTTPIKQGKLTPGTNIPVKSYESFKDDFPEYALLFAYNHAKEIMEKEKEFKACGGNWIIYVPEVKII